VTAAETPRRADRRPAAIAARRAAREKARASNGRADRTQKFVFGAVVLTVLAVGGFLAFGDFLNRPATTAAGMINVQSSMAGFTPSVITVKAGETVNLDWWTQDAAPHLQGGVHTMIAPDLGLNEQLAAESRRTVTWTVPNMPGTYDVWCETCCGGKDSPTMHGKIVIEPASAA
jgi:plastocyanin